MSQKAIRALIESRLKTWADAKPLTVSWPSQTFVPPPGVYLLFSLLPADTGSEDLEGKHRRYLGVAQITVAVPLNSAPADAETLIPELDTLFPCSTYLTDAGLRVLIETPISAGPAQIDEPHYIVPVSFNYRADVML